MGIVPQCMSSLWVSRSATFITKCSVADALTQFVCVEASVDWGWFYALISNGAEAFDHHRICPIRSKSTHMPFHDVYTTRGNPYSL
jgi:hypothetical protein